MRVSFRLFASLCAAFVCSVHPATAAEQATGKQNSFTAKPKNDDKQGKPTTNSFGSLMLLNSVTNTSAQSIGQNSKGEGKGGGGSGIHGGSTTNIHVTDPTAANDVGGSKPNGTTTTAAPAAALATSTPILAHWKFDETSGTLASDSSGNSLNGTLSGSGASFVSGGKSGNALQLSKAANGFVNMGNVLSLSSGSFSIAVWVKMNAGDTTDASFLVTKHTPGYGNGYFLNVNTAGGPSYGQVNKAMFYETSGNVSGSAYSTTSMNDGLWHHLVAVYDAGVQKRVYVDGTPVEGTGVAGGIAANNSPFLVGGLVTYGTSTPSGYFTGLIDELIIFGKALTVAEVDEHYGSYFNILPNAPASLAAVAGNQQVSLTWAAATPGVTSYKVKRATAPGGPYIQAGTPTGTSFVDSALNNGTAYYYVVSAVNATGEGPSSTEASATPVAPPLPNAPTGLAAVAGNQQVTLTWAAASPAVTSYKVKRATAPGGPYTQAGTPTGTTFVDSALVNGTTYYYVVSAVNFTGEGANSTEVNATPVAPPLPNAPGNLTAVAGNQSVTLSWAASTPGVTGYKVKRAPAAGGPFTQVGTPTGLSFVDTALVNGTPYFYLVSAVNFSGDGPDSALTSATPVAPVLPIAPGGLVAVAGNQKVTLTWVAVSPVSYYVVKRSSSASGPFVFLADAGTTTFVDTDLNNGTTYYYRVSAINGTVEGPDSATASATPIPLLAHWKFDETSGTTASDSSGSAFHGAMSVSGSSFVPGGKSGNALQLSKAANGFVNMGNVLSLTSGSFSIAVWMKMNPGDTTDASFLVTKHVPGYANGWFLNVNTAGGPAYGQVNKIMFYDRSGDVTGSAYSTANVNDGTWHHVVTVYETGVQKRVYVDGTPVEGTGVAGGIVPPGGLPNSAPFLVGGLVTYGTASPSGYFTGWLDELMIFGKALSNTEIDDLFNSYSAPPPVLPNPPGNLTAVGGDQQVSLSWAASTPNVTSYTVQRATSSAGPFSPVATGLTALGWLDTAVVNGTAYFYFVTALNAAGESLPSATVSATPDAAPTVPPNAPPNLTAVAGNQQVTLSWSPSTPAVTVYYVKYALSASGTYNVSPPITGTTYVVPGLINGTPYFFAVSAFNAAGEGPNSTEVSATPTAAPPPVPPNAPANLTAVAGNQQVTLSWTASTPNVTRYDVKRSETPGSGYLPLGSVTGTSALDNNGLVNGTTYYYIVTAVNADGDSPDSAEVSATPVPPSTPPNAPNNLTAVPGDQRVVLTWTATAGAASYNVKRYDASSGTYLTLGSVTGTAALDFQAANGTTYSYVVSAVNAAGESPNSSPASATPAASTAIPTPIARADAFQVEQDAGATPLGILDNDEEAFGYANSISQVTPAARGTVSYTADGRTFDYTPVAGEFGIDSFTYTIANTAGGQGSASVYVFINQTGNTPPTTEDLALTLPAYQTTLTFSASVNALDADNDPVQFAAFIERGKGALAINASGMISYTRPAGLPYPDHFSYALTDGKGGLAVQDVTVTPQDTDGDGLPDEFELAFGLNVNADDSLDDPDNDGLPNLAEYLLHTNPTVGDNPLDLMPLPLGTVSGVITFPLPISPDADAGGFALLANGEISRAEVSRNGSGAWQMVWDTQYEPNGNYSAALTFAYSTQRTTGRSQQITVFNPVTFDFLASQFTDTVFMSMTLANPTANYTLYIKSLQGVVLKSITGSTSNGKITETWDKLVNGQQITDKALRVEVALSQNGAPAAPPSGVPVPLPGTLLWSAGSIVGDQWFTVAWGLDAANISSIVQVGAVDVLDNPGTGPYDGRLLPAPESKFHGGVMKMFSTSEMKQVKEALATSANFYWDGHGEADKIHAGSSPVSSYAKLEASAVRSRLKNHRTTGSNTDRNEHPYRLVWLNACNTYSVDWCHAFGFDYSPGGTPFTVADFRIIRRPPHAFIGYTTPTRGPLPGVQFSDATQATKAFWDAWVSGDSIAVAMDRYLEVYRLAPGGRGFVFLLNTAKSLNNYRVSGCKDLKIADK